MRLSPFDQHLFWYYTICGSACFGGGLELWSHIENVLTAMQGAAAELELDGRLAAARADG